jgi:hypothetical protein
MITVAAELTLNFRPLMPTRSEALRSKKTRPVALLVRFRVP